jgi:hypothetical protein
MSTQGLPKLVISEGKNTVMWSEVLSERAMVPENVQFQLRRRYAVRDL